MPQPQQHRIQATSVTCTTDHGNARSLTDWAKPGIEPASSWILVRFVSTEPWRELLYHDFDDYYYYSAAPGLWGNKVEEGVGKGRLSQVTFPDQVRWIHHFKILKMPENVKSKQTINIYKWNWPYGICIDILWVIFVLAFFFQGLPESISYYLYLCFKKGLRKLTRYIKFIMV